MSGHAVATAIVPAVTVAHAPPGGVRRRRGFRVAMTLYWLAYISMNLIAPHRLEQEIAQLIGASCARNAALGITGALIATRTHLAQYMEGPGEAVDDLMGRIARDGRHKDLHVIDRGTRPDRLFPDWQMGYVGGSVFMRRRVADLFEAAPLSRVKRADQLIDLMREFARQPE